MWQSFNQFLTRKWGIGLEYTPPNLRSTNSDKNTVLPKKKKKKVSPINNHDFFLFFNCKL